MAQFAEQVKRIKTKLNEASHIDLERKVFGASSHEYFINEPLSLEEFERFENQHNLSFPECYKTFITQIGNGGNSSQESAAGPYYGIFPFGYYLEDYSHNQSILTPDMTYEAWYKECQKIVKDVENRNDEDYDRLVAYVFGGLLPVGSQGCSYLHTLVMNGKYKGRVANINDDFIESKPTFSFNNNFLDWYEGWLDGIICGDLLQGSSGSYGFVPIGSEEELCQAYLIADTEKTKSDYLWGLRTKVKIGKNTESALFQSYDQAIGKTYEEDLLRNLTALNYDRTKPLLLNYAARDFEIVAKLIFWYAKENAKDPE